MSKVTFDQSHHQRLKNMPLEVIHEKNNTLKNSRQFHQDWNIEGVSRRQAKQRYPHQNRPKSIIFDTEELFFSAASCKELDLPKDPCIVWTVWHLPLFS